MLRKVDWICDLFCRVVVRLSYLVCCCVLRLLVFVVVQNTLHHLLWHICLCRSKLQLRWGILRSGNRSIITTIGNTLLSVYQQLIDIYSFACYYCCFWFWCWCWCKQWRRKRRWWSKICNMIWWLMFVAKLNIALSRCHVKLILTK